MEIRVNHIVPSGMLHRGAETRLPQVLWVPVSYSLGVL